MDSQEIQHRYELLNSQTINVIGFILFTLNYNFGARVLFIPMAILFIMSVVLGLRIYCKKEKPNKKVRNSILKIVVNGMLFAALCVYGYLAKSQ